MSIRVLLTHEHRLFGESLASALDAQPGVEVVRHCVDARGLLVDVARLEPDLVLLRPGFVDHSLAGVCERIHAAGSRVLVVDDGPDADVLLDGVQAEADGYVTLDGDLDDLVAAVRRVHGGEVSVPPLMLGQLLRGLIARKRFAEAHDERFGRLTPRELEVLQLLTDGLDQDAVADSLYISAHTARTHIQNILRKLEVHSRLEAVALVVTAGFMQPRAVEVAS